MKKCAYLFNTSFNGFCFIFNIYLPFILHTKLRGGFVEINNKNSVFIFKSVTVKNDSYYKHLLTFIVELRCIYSAHTLNLVQRKLSVRSERSKAFHLRHYIFNVYIFCSLRIVHCNVSPNII